MCLFRNYRSRVYLRSRSNCVTTILLAGGNDFSSGRGHTPISEDLIYFFKIRWYTKQLIRSRDSSFQHTCSTLDWGHLKNIFCGSDYMKCSFESHIVMSINIHGICICTFNQKTHSCVFANDVKDSSSKKKQKSQIQIFICLYWYPRLARSNEDGPYRIICRNWF